MKILFLGDSYTIGEGVQPSQNWPMQLVEELKTEHFPITENTIIAKTGWTTKELYDAIDNYQLSREYDLVTLLIGVNNLYQGQDIVTYREEFKLLLNRAIQFTGHHQEKVIVISIPGDESTQFGQNKAHLIQRKKQYPLVQELTSLEIGQSIDQYNAVAKQVIAEINTSTDKSVNFIDITALTRQHANLTVIDGLHYSKEMYRVWIERLLPCVRQILMSK